MSKILFRRVLFLLSVCYIFLRLMMLIKNIDNQTVFFYKDSLEPSFFYSDLLFLVGWFVYVNRLITPKIYKFLLLIGGAFTLVVYLSLALLYSVQFGETKVLPSNQVNEEYVIRIGELAGIHPGNDLHRDLLIYKKILPLTYKKVYETNRSLEWDDLEAYRKGDIRLITQNEQWILLLGSEEIFLK